MHSFRFITLACALCLFVLCLAGPARAASSPSDALRANVDQVLLILKNPDYADKTRRPPLRAEIERIARIIFDFTEFSKRTLANYWSSFNPDQQQRFTEAFSALLMASYLDKVNGYNGEKVVYLGERLSQNNLLAVVQTTITLSTGQVTPVTYRMFLKNHTWRVYDVLVENVSLNSNYRVQFNEILTQSSPDELIRRIEDRVNALR